MNRSIKSKLRLTALAAVVVVSSAGCTIPYLGGLAGTDCMIYILEPVPLGRIASPIIPGIIETGCLNPV